MTRRIPIGKCPSCNHPIIYSSRPSSKWEMILQIADDDFPGRTVICAKCKKMLAIVEIPIAVPEPTAVPALKST